MSSILALDVGNRRIGIARAHMQAKLPEPLKSIDRKLEEPVQAIIQLIDEHEAELLIVGLPVSLSGNKTGQTLVTSEFTDELKRAVNIPVEYVDEALTTVTAEAEANNRNDESADIDSLAACYILQNYFDKSNAGVPRG